LVIETFHLPGNSNPFCGGEYEIGIFSELHIHKYLYISEWPISPMRHAYWESWLGNRGKAIVVHASKYMYIEIGD